MGEYRMILLPFYFLFFILFTLSEKLSSEWRIPYSLCPTTNLISGLPGYQLVKNWPAVQETHFDSWVRKIHWKRDRVPTPVFLGFPCGSTGKESAGNVGDLSSIPGLGRFPWRRERLPTPVFQTGEYSPWCHKELDTAE